MFEVLKQNDLCANRKYSKAGVFEDGDDKYFMSAG